MAVLKGSVITFWWDRTMNLKICWLWYISLDNVIPHRRGKVELHNKELQAVDTKWDLILFWVPADVDMLAFHDMIVFFFRKAMVRMRAINPTKYPYEKYRKNLLEFVVLSGWLFNAPYHDKSETEGILFWWKRCLLCKWGMIRISSGMSWTTWV